MAQLKITPALIRRPVLVPFAPLVMDQPLQPDSLWARLWRVGAEDFIFRG